MLNAERILAGDKVEVDPSAVVPTVFELICILSERAIPFKNFKNSEYSTSQEYTQWLKEADNFLSFLMMDSCPDTLAIYAAMITIRRFKFPYRFDRLQNFALFSDRYNKMIEDNEMFYDMYDSVWMKFYFDRENNS